MGYTGVVMTYDQVHYALRWAQGKANEHPCEDCGAWDPLAEWSYDHTAECEHMDESTGFPYDPHTYFETYQPRCGSCHSKLDLTPARLKNLEATPEQRSARSKKAWEARDRTVVAEAMRRSQAGRTFEQRSAAAKKAAATMGPERTAEMAAGARAVAASMRRKCDECPAVFPPAGMGNHQRYTGHKGWTTYEEPQ